MKGQRSRAPLPWMRLLKTNTRIASKLLLSKKLRCCCCRFVLNVFTNLLRQLQAQQADHERFMSVLERQKADWITPLSDLISRINDSYGDFFRRLDCVGEVHLKKPTNEEDFKQYGIEILVKFRHEEPLQPLTAHHQSGGERSVATMLYLMALQALTKCPFRVVDEINQGMDARNERRVFSQVLHCSSSSETSQYFLVTPKLLTNLEYNDKARILCVYNGSQMLSHDKWDLAQMISKKLGAEGST
eukprot:m.477770 g.477770  ORF g.477770 m.477770 type:complete len:245 (+) comp57163_c0_seq23:2506-3240(+)